MSHTKPSDVILAIMLGVVLTTSRLLRFVGGCIWFLGHLVAKMVSDNPPPKYEPE